MLKRLGVLILTSMALSALCAELAMAGSVLPETTQVRRDIDGDGVYEAQVTLRGRAVERSVVDTNHDTKPDAVIYYRDGHRDWAAHDADADGTVDTWVYYYFTGVPWKIAEDYNEDGKPDYWIYLKNGVPYRWDEDLNGDGFADVQTTFNHMTKKMIRQDMDRDYDGVYDTSIGAGRAGVAFVPQKLKTQPIS